MGPGSDLAVDTHSPVIFSKPVASAGLRTTSFDESRRKLDALVNVAVVEEYENRMQPVGCQSPMDNRGMTTAHSGSRRIQPSKFGGLPPRTPTPTQSRLAMDPMKAKVQCAESKAEANPLRSSLDMMVVDKTTGAPVESPVEGGGRTCNLSCGTTTPPPKSFVPICSPMKTEVPVVVPKPSQHVVPKPVQASRWTMYGLNMMSPVSGGSASGLGLSVTPQPVNRRTESSPGAYVMTPILDAQPSPFGQQQRAFSQGTPRVTVPSPTVDLTGLRCPSPSPVDLRSPSPSQAAFLSIGHAAAVSAATNALDQFRSAFQSGKRLNIPAVVRASTPVHMAPSAPSPCQSPMPGGASSPGPFASAGASGMVTMAPVVQRGGDRQLKVQKYLAKRRQLAQVNQAKKPERTISKVRKTIAQSRPRSGGRFITTPDPVTYFKPIDDSPTPMDDRDIPVSQQNRPQSV